MQLLVSFIREGKDIQITYLVGSLVQLLGIERGTNAESDTRAEENVVGNGGDTAVVDLAL